MIRLCISACIICLFLSCENKIIQLDTPSIIPAPQSMDVGNGNMIINAKTTIYLENEQIDASIFQEQLKFFHGMDLNISEVRLQNQIRLSLDTELSENPTFYKLNVSEKLISIEASDTVGLFYGMQTLIQSIQAQNDQLFIPTMNIEDFAEFPHRGLLLDCSRHFFDVSVVKKYIDLLAFYKMNVLHWHLTEDQGWRLAIDKYPKLTEISAWRTETDGSKYGGYYTKAQVRDIVDYATKRQITIIPEIELPGHSQAALAAYPELSCIGGNITVANDWGVFKEIYCAGNEDTFTFLENVLTEVMDLFPSEYIHIGGDEAPKYRWENCSKCQARIEAEHLEDEHELQAYFIRRIEKFLNKNGRKLIGWDEIMEGGLSPSATVQAWRGVDYGVQAANAGNNVIFSPTSHSYLDYDLKAIDLPKVYSFNPISAKINKKKVLGMEVNMWTEHVPDEKTLDQKVFPRLMAMAEVAWTFNSKRNFDEFLPRVRAHYKLLEKLSVNYGAEARAVNISPDTLTNGSLILSPGVKGVDLQYQINGGEWKNYTTPLKIDFSGEIKVQGFLEEAPYGESVAQPVSEHMGISGTLSLNSTYSSSYSGGSKNALIDGLLGTLDFRDGRWQGYFGQDLTASLDLREEKPINEISLNFYQYNNAWIFLPKTVQVEYSSDGQKWSKPVSVDSFEKPEKRGQFIETITIPLEKGTRAKYIRIKAESLMTVPEWHEAAGSKAWLFVDEIMVK